MLTFEHQFATLPEPLWVACQPTPVAKPSLIAFHDDDRFIGMDFDAPAIDLAGLSRSLGVEAETVTNPKDFEQALNTALKDSRPRLIEVMVEPGPQRPGKN